MKIIIFLLGLSLLITIHELGHFIVAKLFGVYCHEFSIGMGPAIYSFKKGETKYSIRWLPIGGYVSMAGEEVNSENKSDSNDDKLENSNTNEESNLEISENKDSDIQDVNSLEIEKNEIKEEVEEEKEKLDIPYERTINGIKPWKRFLVIGAGVFMNFILAYILFFIYVASVGLADTSACLNVNYSSSESEVFAFNEAGIPEGKFSIDKVTNRITYIYQGNEVEIYNETVEDFNKYDNLSEFDELSNSLGVPSLIGEDIALFNEDIEIQNNDDGSKVITFNSNSYQLKQYLVIVSDGQTYTPSRLISKLVFNNDTTNNTYTITASSMPKFGYTQCSRDATIGECFKYAGVLEVENGLAIFKALGQLFTKEGLNNVGGIIAMADASNTMIESGFGMYMAFLGLISVNLGVMNLLPIPGLDGSQLLVIVLEGITRKKIPDNAKAIINFIGLIFLLGLMVLITIKDVFTFLI